MLLKTIKRIKHLATDQPGESQEQPVEQRMSENMVRDARRGMLESQLKILGKLIECELGLAALYDIYSQQIPDMSKFWATISASEHRHAELATALYEGFKSGSVSVRMNRGSAKSIELFVKMLDDAINRAQREPHMPADALITALSLEASLVETEFYRSLHTHSAEMLSDVRTLLDDTHRHKELLEDTLKALRVD